MSLISTGATGFSYARSRSTNAALVSAAGACGDAVADGVGAICNGIDPGVAIVAASQVCGNALAGVYARSTAGALVLPEGLASLGQALLLPGLVGAREGAGLAPSKADFFQACAAGCNNAQSAAEALAQGAACGASKATDACAAVRTEVRGARRRGTRRPPPGGLAARPTCLRDACTPASAHARAAPTKH